VAGIDVGCVEPYSHITNKLVFRLLDKMLSAQFVSIEMFLLWKAEYFDPHKQRIGINRFINFN
jgi:hypothetical protein